ncbi:MAG: amino acid adenylation domain-containing protein, partial [Jatrophihabitantaceae bacterium]
MSRSVAMPSTHHEDWPAVLVPTDRPRLAGQVARCTATASISRDSVALAPDQFLLACFAALLFRYSGQRRINVAHGGQQTRYLVTGKATVAELVRAQRPGPVVDQADRSGELRLDVGPQRIELHYDPALFDPASADQLLANLRTLTADAARTPQRPIELLQLMSKAELRTVLVDWNDTGRRRDDRRCLHTGFELAAAGEPDAIAVVQQGRRWTYAEINRAANRLAHYLRGQGIGPDVRVGICLPRSARLLIGVLAVLKAGGAFVPIDPQHPPARVASMVTGSRCALMITESGLAGALDAEASPQLLLDRDAELLADQPSSDLAPSAGPDNLCYIIHTSGSTGIPKPIALRHQGVTNNLEDLNSRFEVGADDSVLALSSPSFDMSIYEFLGLTAAGGTVVIPDPELVRDPAHWAQLIAEEQVTIWNSAPALLGLLTDQSELAGNSLPSLRLALLGGDWVPLTLPDRARQASPALRVIVMGGATEASIHSTIFEVTELDPAWTSIPYGRAMANQRTYILDEAGQPVPPGVPGELQLAGTGLARGYLDQPELTAARFHEWSYGQIQGERLYRTGDLARYDRDGLIELLGRIDLQVKINGLRIELGEIESVLLGHPAVRQVATAARDNQLVGYVVLEKASSGSDVHDPIVADQLIKLAAERLPDYMVPSHVVVLDRLPLSPNGKVDRAALPAPEPDRAPYRPPSSAAELLLAELVGQLLGVDRVGLDDDLLSLGGDSVRTIQLVSRAKARGLIITAADVLGLRTIEAIAAVARSQPGASPQVSAPAAFELVDPAGRAALVERYPGLSEIWPMTPMQAGMLFEALLDEQGGATYRLQTIIELTAPAAAGRLDADRLRGACNQLVARHASLRAGFVSDVTDDPVQVVLAGAEPPWQQLDLSQLSAAEQAGVVDRLLGSERESLPDLDSPPLLRFALAALAADRALLVLSAHHVLYDGWSEQLLAGELAELYAGIELAPAGNFRDYLQWLARQDRAAGVQAWRARLAGAGPTLLAAAPDPAQPVAMRQLLVPLGGQELVPDHRLRVTRGTIAQAAWAIALAELTGTDEVTFGVTVSGRPGELPGVESTIGLFINTIPLRVRVDPDQRIAELFEQLAGAQVSMLAHEHLSLSDIQEAAGVGRLFDTLLVCQSFPAAGTGNDAVRVGKIDSIGMGNYPLTLLVEADRLVLQYDQRCHDAERIVMISERFRQLAGQLTGIATADRTVGSL